MFKILFFLGHVITAIMKMVCASNAAIIHFIKVNLNVKVNHSGDEYYYTKIQHDL